MELKPGYKQTEVGVIPEEWEVPEVGDVCGCIVPGRNKPKLFDGDIPWITTPDLQDGKPVSISRLGLCISRAEAKSVGSKIVPPGSVLMSCAGELGIVALTANEIVANQQLHVFLPTVRIDGTYLLNALSYRKGQIAGLGTKTAVPYLNKSSCNSIPILLPPLPEQRAIAAALSDVDGLLGGLDRLIAKKRDLKQAAMQQLLTGQTRLPGFDGEWELKRLGDVATIATGNTPPTSDASNYGDEFHFVSPADMGDNKFIIKTEKMLSKKGFSVSRRFPKNSILFVSIGSTIGKCGIAPVELTSNQQINAIFPSPTFSTNYLFYAVSITAPHIRAQAGEQAVPIVNKAQFSETTVKIPPLPEQTAIAEVLTEMDAELAALAQRREKTRALKQAMMQELLTGRTRLQGSPADLGNGHATAQEAHA